MKFAIKTLGCKVNTYESNYLRELLLEYCQKEVPFHQKADIYVINTCTITQAADQKSRQLIKKIKNQHPRAILVVLGCFVHFHYVQIKQDADIVIGNNQKSKIIEMIDAYQKTNEKQVCFAKEMTTFEDMQIKNPKQTRAFVKIQDGCNNYCTYCIIPYVRGKARSRCYQAIITEINQLVANGFQEIVLTGINVGVYGEDIGKDLVFLLEEIVKKTKLKRLRLSSIEVVAVNEKMLKFLAKKTIFVNHMHIPLQSGSNKILKKMNRQYSQEDFLATIKKLKKIRPRMLITTDIIVGFPGESEKDFQETRQVVEKAAFYQGHIFRYSAKKFTKSYDMKDHVVEKTKKARQKELSVLFGELKRQHLHNYVNQQLMVIFEQKKGEYLIGYSDAYVQVKVPYQKGLLKRLVNVKIKEVDYPYLKGVIA